MLKEWVREGGLLPLPPLESLFMLLPLSPYQKGSKGKENPSGWIEQKKKKGVRRTPTHSLRLVQLGPRSFLIQPFLSLTK